MYVAFLIEWMGFASRVADSSMIEKLLGGTTSEFTTRSRFRSGALQMIMIMMQPL